MTRHVNDCIRELGYRFYGDRVDGSVMQGPAIYHCGAAIQWFAEAALLKDGTDIFSLWNRMFAISVLNGTYSADDFFSRLDTSIEGARAAEAIRLLVNADEKTNFTSLSDTLQPLGIRLRDAPEMLTARRFIGRLVVPLLRAHCVPPHNFRVRWTGTRFVVDLFTGDRCGGAFANNPSLIRVEGFDLIDESVMAYEAAAVRCSRGEELTFSTFDQGNFAFKCDTMLPPPPILMTLTAPWAQAQPF